MLAAVAMVSAVTHLRSVVPVVTPTAMPKQSVVNTALQDHRTVPSMSAVLSLGMRFALGLENVTKCSTDSVEVPVISVARAARKDMVVVVMYRSLHVQALA